MSKALRAIIVAGSMLLAASGSTSTIVPDPVALPSGYADTDGTPLSLLTYNVEGLPWPIVGDRTPALTRIAARLVALRRAGRQPHIVLLQEAFTPEAAAIARTAGYANAAFGPDEALRTPIAATDDDGRYLRAARWDRGEQWGKKVGSGLIILSDYPIERIDRMAFPDFACAGFDCLANKGAVIAHVRVPGHVSPVAVVDTHLNARKAAGVPLARSQAAYARQAVLLAQFVAAHVGPDQAVLFGGDMNIGSDAARRHSFFAAFERLNLPFVASGLGGAERAIGQATVSDPRTRRDLLGSVRRRKDWVFARDAAGATMAVARAQVPFGSERGGNALSDHVGYVIDYRVATLGDAPKGERLHDPEIALRRRTLRLGGIAPASARGEARTLSYDARPRSRVTAMRVEDRFAIGDRLEASVGWRGLKVSNRNINATGNDKLVAHDWFLPRATLAYQPTAALTITLGYRETMRAYEGAGSVGSLGLTRGDFDVLRAALRPERSRQYRIDGQWDVSDLRLSLGGFRADMRDMLGFADRSYLPLNAGSVALSGISAVAEHRLTPTLSWSARYRRAGGRTPDARRVREDEIGIGGDWTSGAWHGALGVARSSPMALTNMTPTGRVMRIDAAIDYATTGFGGRPLHLSARLTDPSRLIGARLMEETGALRAADRARGVMMDATMIW